MNFLGNLFRGDSDEILFFILVFLFLFSGKLFDNGIVEGAGSFDGGTVLFFIILFLLLFFNQDGPATV